MSRRLALPEPPLADEQVRLEPLTQADHAELLALAGDDAVKSFTLVPTRADAEFVTGWIARYEQGWADGKCAGFVARDATRGGFLAFAAVVQLDLEARQGEIGYAVAPAARGRGVAGRVLALLTRWGFDELGLVRLELQIDVANAASERVAARAGYALEGVRRSLHFKEGRRADSGIWSRLRDDLPVT
ncbi:MAG TPA: GNAT family protein [Gaiellaceae bacterium]|nr:GNAT family protein [Gaiellaceae bacterium]